MSLPQTSPLRALWPLEPGRTFVNHGSYGACPQSVLQEQQKLKENLESAPSDFMNRLYPRLLKPVRDKVADFLKCTPADLAFSGNATAGINAVLRSLSWQPGDEILLTDHGYAACANVVSYLQQRYGVCPVMVSLPFPNLSSAEIVKSVLGGLSSRTRLAMLCHVTSPTAVVLPISRLASELRARKVSVLVDGAHAAGMLELNLTELAKAGVDYYAGNFHKWCYAPHGAGFLWAREEKQSMLYPGVISHGFAGPVQTSRFLQQFDWCGTFDPTAWLAIPHALEFVQALHPEGWTGIRNVGKRLLLQARELVAEVLPDQLLVEESHLGLMASLELPASVDPQALYLRLYDGYRIDSWLTQWNDRTLIRLSAAPYNTLDDYKTLRDALGELL